MQPMQKIGKTLFGMAVAAALAFGATEAGASGAGARNCPYDPQAGWVGACSSQESCDQTCLSYYPENGGSSLCRNGCCLCLT